MPKRIDLGTDIAMIGVWDPARERHDLKAARSTDFDAGLQSEALAARLFFINTGGDGGHLTDIYVDEADPDLTLYSTVEREFLISSESGLFIAGGVEDFISPSKQITSEESRFAVSPGMYALRVYELIEDKFDDRLRQHVGAEDYRYYESKFAGFPWGCLLFAIAVTAGFVFTKWWIVSVSLFALLFAYLYMRFRIHRADHRFQDIVKRIESFENAFPPFIFVLRRVTEIRDLKGGWYDLVWTRRQTTHGT